MKSFCCCYTFWSSMKLLNTKEKQCIFCILWNKTCVLHHSQSIFLHRELLWSCEAAVLHQWLLKEWKKWLWKTEIGVKKCDQTFCTQAQYLGNGDWLCFSSILAVTQSEPREQCPSRKGWGLGWVEWDRDGKQKEWQRQTKTRKRFLKWRRKWNGAMLPV